MYVNKAIICGNLCRDPELRWIPSTGVPVTTFAVATNRSWTDETGARQQAAEYHNVVVYGRQAQPSAEHLKKGQLVLVEGRLQTRTWEQDGATRARTEIIAERVQFGPKRARASADETEPETLGESAPADKLTADDEIPF